MFLIVFKKICSVDGYFDIPNTNYIKMSNELYFTKKTHKWALHITEPNKSNVLYDFST